MNIICSVALVVRENFTAVKRLGTRSRHARDLRTSGPSVHFPVSSHKFPPSTSATRALGTKSNHSVLFPPYPREMKTNTRNLNLPPFCRLFVSMEMVQPIPTRALSRARGLGMRTHLTAVDA